MASSVPNERDDEDVIDVSEEEPKWIRKKGPIALRSKVWNHFKEKKDDKTMVKCDYCPKVFKFSSSTTGIRNHLLNVHRIKDLGKDTSIQDVVNPNAGQVSIQVSMANHGKPWKTMDEVILHYDSQSKYRVTHLIAE